MSPVIRLFTALFALALLVAGALPTVALAGEATPAGGTPVAASDTPRIGDAVPIYDPESFEEIATITVESVTDPFEGYDEFYAPESGSRYVAVEYTITNEISNDSIDSPAYYLTLSTTNGILLTSTYIALAEDADIEELTTEPILGDESATGTLFYIVPEDAEIGGISYIDYTYYTLLADIGGTSVPELGDEATAYAEGEAYASLAVTDYVDPFEDYGEFYEPDADSRYIAATVSVENLIPNDGIDISTYQFYLQTVEGLLLSSTYIEVSDDSDLDVLEDGRIAGGESTAGTVFFLVPEDVEITGVIFQPQYDVVVNLGNPEA